MSYKGSVAVDDGDYATIEGRRGMSELKSLGKLRQIAEKLEDRMTIITESDCIPLSMTLWQVANEIEREIAERYMELPVDADGVPIHVGDVLERGYVVDYVAPNWCLATGRGAMYADMCHHVKPRTLEDVLKELACDVRREWVENAPLAEHVYSEYADKIRELMGGAE